MTGAGASPPTATAATFNFQYDATNRRTNQTATDNSWWSYPTTASSTGYTANNLDQYTAVGSASPTYDADGNLTYDGTDSYCYDAESRLTEILSAGTCASPTTVVASYAYDAQGRRKSKSVGSTTTIYVTDADNREVLEYDGTSGAVGTWYAYGPGPNDVLNQMNGAGTDRQTLIPDVQGSILASLDASTGALSKTGYQPFGENPSLSSGSFQYTAARFDPESRFYYMRTRMYRTDWGRFMQPDTIGFAGGNNLYAYVQNDPLNLIDPLGLCDNPQGCGGSGSGLLANAGNYVLSHPGKAIGGALATAGIVACALSPCVAVEAAAGGVAAVGGITLTTTGVAASTAVVGGTILMNQNQSESGSASNTPSAGNLKQASNSDLQAAAQADGYSSVEAWKQQELQLDSRSNIVKDAAGNLYSIPRQGVGSPQPLGVKLPR